MSSKNKSAAAVIAFFAAAVIFFIAILVVAVVVPDENVVQEVDDGMVITDMQVDMVWKADRSCSVSQKISVRFQDVRHGIYVDIPVNSGERVRDLTVKVTDYRGYNVPYELQNESFGRIVRAKIGSEHRLYGMGDTMVCQLNYNYFTPEHPDGKNILDINPIGTGWACVIENATVNVTFPAEIGNYALWAQVGGIAHTPELSADRKTATVQTGRLNPFSGVRVMAKMPDGVLHGAGGFEGIVTVVVGIAVVIAVILLMVFVGKDKPITPVVGFYPPYIYGVKGEKRRMLPVQMGKIIDGTCSSKDVTSLIFYWASQGYLSIEEDGDTTYLIKQKDVDPVTEYERKMFNALFQNVTYDSETGKAKVRISDLSGGFATHISSTVAAVNAEYRGTFYKKGYTALSVLLAVGIVLLAVLNAVLVTLRVGSWFFNIVGVIVVLPVIIAYAFGTVIVRSYFKLSTVKRYVFLVLFFFAVMLVSVGVMLAVPTHAMGWTEKIIFGLCVGVSSAFLPFLTKRKFEYTEMLNDVIGFRNFLRDVEKDRLETLLADDPQYYYDILPYANVLGVSKIWQDKFEKLEIEPPTYYRGNDISLFDLYVISRLNSSIGTSLSYKPPKVNVGSFSGGGGRFGGGGGGHFGGFGGGGGGSW